MASPQKKSNGWKQRFPRPHGVKEAMRKKRAVHKVKQPKVGSKEHPPSSSLADQQKHILKKLSKLQALMDDVDIYLNQLTDPD